MTLAETHLWWYVARSSGLVAWGMLTASVLWGLAMSTKLLKGRAKPAWVLDLHRYLGGAAVVFTGVHLTGLLLDSYVGFGPTELFVPFASAYRPSAVAWGVAALYLLLAVELSSLLRRRLPRKVWRGIHMASFPLFVASTVHGVTAGTDSQVALAQTAFIAGAAVVAALVAVRVAALEDPPAAGSGASSGRALSRL